MEMIVRKMISGPDGMASVQRTKLPGWLQTSFNSDGCIVLRIIDNHDDTLIVLDKAPSWDLIRFIRNLGIIDGPATMRETAIDSNDKNIPF